MTTLTKNMGRRVVFEVEGQPFIPASFDCYPPPPEGPPNVDPPGGGGGSGPPGGDGCVLVPVYQHFFLCSGYPPGDPRGSPPCLPSDLLVGYIEQCP